MQESSAKPPREGLRSEQKPAKGSGRGQEREHEQGTHRGASGERLGRASVVSYRYRQEARVPVVTKVQQNQASED